MLLQGMHFIKRATYLILGTFLCLPALSATPKWETSDHQNAIGKSGLFLVIRHQEEPYCYLKQSYYDNPDRMELTIVKGKTLLKVLNHQSLVGDLTYWVDSGPKYTTPPLNTKVELDTSLHYEMKAGSILYVQAQLTGGKARTQNFPLDGFTAALNMLQNPMCKY